MKRDFPGGYKGRILRVNLTEEKIIEDRFPEPTLRKYIGGVGLAAKIIYDEVPPGTPWDHPDNLLILALGPLNGTRIAGSGTYTMVTKGPLTGGATSTQASGRFGAYAKFSGYDMLVLKGVSKKWVYLYIHDGIAEIRDAGHLLGKDTVETEEAIKRELGKKEKEISVVGIGLAGENLIKFAVVAGDRGHVASKNGVGAVMGLKRIKAIAAARGDKSLDVSDTALVSELNRDMIQAWKDDPFQSQIYWQGLS